MFIHSEKTRSNKSQLNYLLVQLHFLFYQSSVQGKVGVRRLYRCKAKVA